MKMYHIYNEGKSVVAERIIRTMTALSKNVYFDVLHYIVDK